MTTLPFAWTGRAAAAGSGWVDTRGPGNGTAYALAYAPSRYELYRGTSRGVWRYDETTGAWSDTGGAVSSYTVHVLLWDGYRLYAGTSGHGVWCYDAGAGTWTDISGSELAGKSVSELAWDGSILYAGIYNVGVWRYDPLAAVWVDVSGDLSGEPVQALQWDGSGLYVGTANKGTWYYEPASGTWTDVSGDLGTAGIVSFAWTGSCLYAGTSYKGVWRYDPLSGTWTDISSGVVGYGFRSLAWDGARLYAGASYHNLWTTTVFGVWCYDPVSSTWSAVEGVEGSRVESLALGGSGLYAGTDGDGVWRFDAVGGSWADTGGGISDSEIYALLDDGRYIYAGIDSDGLWRFDPLSEEWSKVATGIGTVNSLACDGSRVYASTGTGLWCYDPASRSLEDIKGGLPGSIYHLAYGGSVLYASTSMPLIPSYPAYYLNGIYRYDPVSNSWSMLMFSFSYKFSVPYVIECGGPFLYMYGLATGTGYVAWRYDPGTGLWTDTDSAGSLKNKTITSLEWGGNYLYAGTEFNGVWRYSPLIGAWSNTGGGIKGVSVYSMAWNGSRLFALGSGSGIWSYDPVWSVWTNLGGARGLYEKYPLACDGPNLYAGSDSMGVWRFDYSDAPAISSLIPSAGAPGTEVIVCGSGFGPSRGSSSVSFGTAQATEYLSWNDTRIRCRVPDMEAGEVEVRVSTTAGTSNGIAFTVTGPGVWVFNASPRSALEGSRNVSLVIEGSGFRPGAEVRLEQADTGTVVEAGGESVLSGSRIACTLDLAGAPLGDYDLVVKNPDAQEGRLEAGFRVTNLCGQGGGTAALMLGMAFGLLSTAVAARRKRRRI